MSTGPNTPSGGNQNNNNRGPIGTIRHGLFLLQDLPLHQWPRQVLHWRGLVRDANRHRGYFQELQQSLQQLIHEDQRQPDANTLQLQEHGLEDANEMTRLIAALKEIRAELAQEVHQNTKFSTQIEEAQNAIQETERVIARLQGQLASARGNETGIAEEARLHQERIVELETLQRRYEEANHRLENTQRELQDAETRLASQERLGIDTEEQQEIVNGIERQQSEIQAELKNIREERAQRTAQTSRNGSANRTTELRNARTQIANLETELREEETKLQQRRAKLTELQNRETESTTRQSDIDDECTFTELEVQRIAHEIATRPYWNYKTGNDQNTISHALEDVAGDTWNGTVFDNNSSLEQLNNQIDKLEAVRNRMRIAQSNAGNPESETTADRELQIDPNIDPEDDHALQYRNLKERFLVLFNRINENAFFRDERFKAQQQEKTIFQMAQELNEEFERAIQYDRAGESENTVHVNNVDQLRIRVENFVRTMQAQIRYFREHLPSQEVLDGIARDRMNTEERAVEEVGNTAWQRVQSNIGRFRDTMGWLLLDNAFIRNPVARGTIYSVITAATISSIGALLPGDSGVSAPSTDETISTQDTPGNTPTVESQPIEITEDTLKANPEQTTQDWLDGNYKK